MPGSLARQGEGGSFAVSGDYAVIRNFADGVAAPGDGSGVGSARVVQDHMGGLDDAAGADVGRALVGLLVKLWLGLDGAGGFGGL